MFWQDEDDTKVPRQAPVVDLSFFLKGRTLPADYAVVLARAVLDYTGLAADTGVYLAAAGEEGNGWYRDDRPDQMLYLSRRSRLLLRVQRSDIDQAAILAASTLNVSGHTITLGEAKVQPLSTVTTQYARHVVSRFDDEAAFLQDVQQKLAAMNIRCQKMLCGKTRSLLTAEGIIQTRSLMLADLNKEDALSLQVHGLGPYRSLGCGFFIAHKSIQALGAEQD